MELSFRSCLDESLGCYESRDHTNGERTATKTESVDLVAGFIVATDELVEIDDVSLQAEAEGATERSQVLVR